VAVGTVTHMAEILETLTAAAKTVTL